jgi:hypothetical protein
LAAHKEREITKENSKRKREKERKGKRRERSTDSLLHYKLAFVVPVLHEC